MAKKFRPPECMVYGVEGLPGAGKSFMLTRRTLDLIQIEQRPVYTNLPIRHRVMRQYLRNRGGEPMANLIVNLSEQHWKAFLKRNERKQKRKAEWQAKCEAEGVPSFQPAFRRIWEEEEGVDVTRPGMGRVPNKEQWIASRYEHNAEELYHERYGVNAVEGTLLEPNWIEPFAAIIIDEVQHWHTVEDNRGGKEGTELKSYITMLRHHFHDLYVASQTFDNIPITLRRFIRKTYQVTALSERKLAWKIRFKHLGIRGISYNCYSKEQLELIKSNKQGGEYGLEPLESVVVFPTLPKYQFIFRLYNSFTHVESPRRAFEKLNEFRRNAGLQQLDQSEIQESKQEKEPMLKRLAGGVFKAAAVVVLVAVGVMFGTSIREKQEPQPIQTETVSTTPQQATPVQWWPEDGRITGMNKQGVMTDEGLIKVGGAYGFGRLRSFDYEGRRALFTDRDYLWVWNLGAARPQRLASRQDLSELEGRINAGRPVETGWTESDSRPDRGGTVGPTESEPRSN